MSGYSHERYAELIDSTVEEIIKLSKLKGGEYAGDDDRLANFRRNGLALGLPMETVWAVYAGKHWDAIQQSIKDLNEGKTRQRLESLVGRADDLIVYLILFKAMLEERTEKSPLAQAAVKSQAEIRKILDECSIRQPTFDRMGTAAERPLVINFGSLQPTET